MNSKYWSFLFFAVLLLHLVSIAMHWPWLRFFTKPLLMVVLFTWFILASPKKLPLRYCIAAALFFSWIGDVCLLQNGNGWFIAGLAAFLLAHVMYIVFFVRVRRSTASPLAWNVYLIAAAVTYALLLFVFLYPYTGHLKIPVGVYAAVITTMLITAAHAADYNSRPIRTYFITGAILFVVSDSLLAINKFYHPLPAGDIGVMLTYGLAQFALTNGSLLYLAENNTQVQNTALHL